MGAWGVDTFENDSAADWKHGLDDVEDLSYVRSTLQQILDIGEEYLEVDEGCSALAACEVVARLKGNWGKRDSFSESLDEWVGRHPQSPEPDLVALAAFALDRVTRIPSELRELWEESDDFSSWQASVADLRRRVTA